MTQRQLAFWIVTCMAVWAAVSFSVLELWETFEMVSTHPGRSSAVNALGVVAWLLVAVDAAMLGLVFERWAPKDW